MTTRHTRAHAAYALRQVIFHQRTIDWVLHQHPEWLADRQARWLVLDTLRYYYSTSAALEARLTKPLRDKDRDVYCLLLVGTYQLSKHSTADHAVVNESVEACGTLRKPWARKLVNGVLRNIIRNRPNDRLGSGFNTEPAPESRAKARQSPSSEAVSAAIAATAPIAAPDSAPVAVSAVSSSRSEHNAYLNDTLQREYSAQFDAIVNAHLSRAPMILRVNHQKTDTSTYLRQLEQAGIAASKVAHVSSAICLQTPQPADGLPGWASGEVAVQDLGAQYATEILREFVGPSLRVLDACAAPGGKTFHLHEQFPQIEQVAVEQVPRRAEDMRQIGHRLGHALSVAVGDATSTEWWDGKRFDVVLLDAPCSGTGTIRRHPEIKLHLRPQEVAAHRATQLKLLHNLWPMLAAGGTLLYCTCSILSAENDSVIAQFIRECSNQSSTRRSPGMPTVSPLTLDRGQPTEFGWQLLPTDPLTDGFYYAVLRAT